MGSALAKGLMNFDESHQITLSLVDPHPEKQKEFKDLYDQEVCQNIEEANLDVDVIVLAVKPQDLKPIVKQTAKKLNPNTLIITILAGITVEDISQLFSFQGPVVRAMPNIAATVGHAITVLCHNQECSDFHRKQAEKIFNTVGDTDWAKESLLDAVTGLSGSGPAYIYMVIEALTDGGVKMGLPRPLALKLATQTVIGAGQLVKETGLHPAVLRDRVTTPGGTTISAIHELEAHGLRSMLISAVVTAAEKSKGLRAKSQS